MASSYLSFLESLRDDEGAYWEWHDRHLEFGLIEKVDDVSSKVEALHAALTAAADNLGDAVSERLSDCLLERLWHSNISQHAHIPNLTNGWSPTSSCLKVLQDIAHKTPHRVVFVNATICLLTFSHHPGQAFLCSAAQDDELQELVWQFHKSVIEKPFQLDPVVAALAKAGFYDAMAWICDELVVCPTPEMKMAAACHGFSEYTPEPYEAFGESNPDFGPALIKFIQRTGLVELLRAEKVDDELCYGALTICSEGLAAHWLDVSDTAEFKRLTSAEEILKLLIRHLSNRPLKLGHLFYLAWIYDSVFEENHRSLTEGTDGTIDYDELVLSEEEHVALSESIQDIFWAPEHRAELDRAIQKGGSPAYNAKKAIARMEGKST